MRPRSHKTDKIMLDVESLGLGAQRVPLLSAGIVVFSDFEIVHMQELLFNVEIECKKAPIDYGTMRFWVNQIMANPESTASKLVLNEQPHRQGIHSRVVFSEYLPEELASLMAEYAASKIYTCHALDMEQTVVRQKYKEQIAYNAWKDYATLRDNFLAPVDILKAEYPHDALSDAEAQALNMIAISCKLNCNL